MLMARLGKGGTLSGAINLLTMPAGPLKYTFEKGNRM